MEQNCYSKWYECDCVTAQNRHNEVYPDSNREQRVNWYEYSLHAGQHECSSSGT